ncbi:MAG TPA: alpha/beta hydrolase [Ktedonobacterales bacterium]
MCDLALMAGESDPLKSHTPSRPSSNDGLWVQKLQAFRASHIQRIGSAHAQLWPYFLGGQGEHVILALHGSHSDGESLFSLVGPLEQTCRVLTPTYPAGVTSMLALVDGLATLLDMLELPPAIVVGYSLGGYVAQALAWRHPHRVAGLALLHTGAPARSSARSAALQNALLAATPASLLNAGAQAGASIMMALESPGLERDAARFWRGYLAQVARRTGKERMREHGRLVVDFLSGRVSAAHDAPIGSHQKTLIVEGELDRTIEPSERRALHLRYPEAVRVVNILAGHLSALTRPAPYLAAITDTFLATSATD